MAGIDILMVTYERPEYVRLSLPHLLSTCTEDTRVWLWHNGDDPATLEAVAAVRDHPAVHRFHHSPDNVGLRAPTNWMWSQSTGDLLGKVDDDCLPEPHWLPTLRSAHEADERLGVVGSWRFPEEDVDQSLVDAKLTGLAGGHRLMRNHWVQGSGYLTKRTVVDRVGPVTDRGFTTWCLRAAGRGFLNGWYYPFIREEHLDDPRSPRTLYRSDAEFLARRPLSARTTGVTTLAEWETQMRRSARLVQTASLDLREHTGWRRRRHNLVRRARRVWHGRAPW